MNSKYYLPDRSVNRLANNRIILCFLFVLIFVKVNGQKKWRLNDFYSGDPILHKKADSIFNKLSSKEKVGQMIIQAAGPLGKSTSTIIKLIGRHQLGGVILLKGEKKAFRALTKKLNSVSRATRSLPLLFSADAEPSLINRKIAGTKRVIPTSGIKTLTECSYVANVIGNELNYMRIKQNFAPTCDLSTGNKAIGNRSFGINGDSVAELANRFIKTMHRAGIVATAKHFPGHGYVVGDTHRETVYIDGELREINVYKPLIDSGLISIMIAHICVKNNNKYETGGLPATCSPIIIKKLLRADLNFKGIVISDAMNMKAVTKFPHATLKAAMAGCDMILMPISETETIKDIVNEMLRNKPFKLQIDESVKKIIRLKICLGLL